VPPIAVNRFGPGEIVSDGEAGCLVEPDDMDALALALRQAIDNPGERVRRGAPARAVAAEQYGWPSLAGRFAAVLDESVVGRMASGADPARAADRDAPWAACLAVVKSSLAWPDRQLETAARRPQPARLGP
jgi:hypothetical protein